MAGENTGFGYYAFGHFPFGYSDFGEDAVIRSFPTTYLEDDEENGGLLKRYLLTMKDQVNQRKKEIDDMEDLVDPNRVRQDILRNLGSTIDLVIDEAEPEDFARTLVNSAVTYYRLKGTRDAYRIRGKISGFDVEVINLYRFDPIYLPFLDPDNVFEPEPGLLLTSTPPGGVPGIPTEQQCDDCFTSYIKVSFIVVKPLPPSTTINFFDRIINKLKTVIPIHVRDILFDLAIVIAIDEGQYLEFNPTLEPSIFIPTPMFPRFDFVPADVVSLDSHGNVSGYIEVL